MGQDATQIRSEIEATRARMGDTVDAIGYKADVPARVRDDINQRIESVKGTIGGAVAGSKKTARKSKAAASDALDDSRERITDAAETTRRAASIALENPLGLALGALAVGFLGGLLIPVSDIERERIKPISDDIAGRAQSAVSEAVEAGKSILNETLATAAESVQQHGKEIAQHAVAGTPLAAS
jgi:hypothetical protein